MKKNETINTLAIISVGDFSAQLRTSSINAFFADAVANAVFARNSGKENAFRVVRNIKAKDTSNFIHLAVVDKDQRTLAKFALYFTEGNKMAFRDCSHDYDTVAVDQFQFIKTTNSSDKHSFEFVMWEDANKGTSLDAVVDNASLKAYAFMITIACKNASKRVASKADTTKAKTAVMSVEEIKQMLAAKKAQYLQEQAEAKAEAKAKKATAE